MNLDRSIGEIVIEEGHLSFEDLSHILATRDDTTEPLGDLLVRLGKISEKQKLKCLGLQMGVPFVDLARVELDREANSLVPHATCIRLLAIPIERTECAASVAMVNPLDLSAIDELAAVTGLEIDPMIATEDDVRDAVYRSYGAYDDLGEIVGEAVRGVEVDSLTIQSTTDDDDPVNVVELKEVVEGAPVIKLANALLSRAINMRASDVHIEPQQRRVRVRFRIDGLLQEVMSVPKDIQYALISRIKIMATLDIAERRIPQDGRCTLISNNTSYDFRVSTFPSVFGENVVIRILDKNTAMLELPKLGMELSASERLRRCVEEPQGLVLVTGPTGSGKTSSLYACIHHLNSIFRNIITIEDPVEYQLDGVVQGNVNPKAGVTFAVGLRSILRQDPDVILVGEVRDGETATIAVEAALTGHMVLTSLHANDAASSVTRLIDMGIESFLLGSSLSCAVAQRLVRVICPKCVEVHRPASTALDQLGLPHDFEYKRGRGCEYCAKTGFRGRAGVFEVLEISPEVRKLILDGAHATDVRTFAQTQGMATLRMDARDKVLSGVTTPEEVIRVTSDWR